LLTLPVKNAAMSLPWKTMSTLGALQTIFDNTNNTYLIREQGITKWWDERPIVSGPFHVASFKYGGNSSHDFHPTIRQFIELLKVAGATPLYTRNKDGPNFSYLFDISTGNDRAIYELGTANHGQEIIALVFCEQLTETIVTSVKAIDEALHVLIRTCAVPTTN